MTEHGDERELLEQIAKYVDGRMSAAEVAALEQRLLDDPEAFRLFNDYSSLHAQLAWPHRPATDLTPAAPASGPSVRGALRTAAGNMLDRRRHPFQFYTMAAVLTLLAWTGFWAIVLPGLRDGDVTDERSVKNAVAFFSGSDNAVWAETTHLKFFGRGDSRYEGPYYAGGSLHLKSGTIRLDFGTGAIVVLEGPAEFTVGVNSERGTRNAEGSTTPSSELQAPRSNCGYLKLGKLTARIETPRAKGFTIETPTATFEDLGTEFGVHVREGGFASMRVFEGEVKVTTISGEDTEVGRVVHKDEAVEVETVAGRPQIAASSENARVKFVRALQLDSHLAVIERIVSTKASMRGDFNGTVGFRFKVANPMVINALGVWDGPGNGKTKFRIGDGLAVDARVGLWDVASGKLLASATAPAGTASNLTADFRYAPLDEGGQFTLEPNVTYCLGTHVTASGNVFSDNYQDTESPSHFFVRRGTGVQHVSGSMFAPNTFSVPTQEGPMRAKDQVRWFVGPNAASIEAFVSEETD